MSNEEDTLRPEYSADLISSGERCKYAEEHPRLGYPSQ